MRSKRSTHLVACTAAILALGMIFVCLGKDIVVTDATDLQLMDTGAVYRIKDNGVIEPVAAGYPLMSPSGILYDQSDEAGDEFFVTDIGTFYGINDGALYKVKDNTPTVEVFYGAPLTSPFGMLRDGCCTLYVSDFGSPFASRFDGVIYEVNLDPDEDGEEGPYPLSASDLHPVITGLEGPNQMVWTKKGKTLLVADDSGTLFSVDLAAQTAEPFGPNVGDPVGLAAHPKAGYAVVDALNQDVYFLDKKGVAASLQLAGDPSDQFLGVAVSKKGTVYVANAGDLFSFFLEDGEILAFDDEDVDIPYSGPPLRNPFSIAVMK